MTDVNSFHLGEFVNWFLFSRIKSWKTYTLSYLKDRRKRSCFGLWSYYDSVIREMVKLVTKESKHENSDYCALFLTLINEMLQSFASEKGNPVSPFNPTFLQCDEHISNYKEIEVVFGNTFFEKRTASCEYHLDKNVNKHQRFVSDEGKIDYKILTSGMKMQSVKMRVKRQLKELIKQQNAAVSKSLTDILNLRDKVK